MNNMYAPLRFSQVHMPLIMSIKANTAPFLLGKPGIGKSSAIRALENELNAKVFPIQVNQLVDRSDLTGQRPVKELDENGKESLGLAFFPHITLKRAIAFANENPDMLSIIFLDEVNRTTADVTSAALAFITERMIGDIKFPDNIRFVAAGNDEGNITALDEASRTRFRFLRVTPDAETFLRVVKNINPFIEEVVKENPSIIEHAGFISEQVVPTQGQNDPDDDDDYEANLLSFTGDDENGFAQACNPRTLEYLSQALNEGHIDNSGSNLERAALANMLEPADNERTVLQVFIEGSIGHCDFTDKLVTKIIEHNNNLLRSAQTTNQTMNALPQLDMTIINQIANSGTIDAEYDYIAALPTAKRHELLIALMLHSNLSKINDNELAKRTVKNILAVNDPIEMSHSVALYNAAQQEPQLFSPVTVNVAVSSDKGSLTTLIPTLKQAIQI